MRWILMLVAAVAVVAGCGGPGDTGSAPVASDEPVAQDAAAPGAGEQAEGLTAATRFAVVPKGLVHQFWRTVKAGADAAGAEFNAEIIWNGPPRETEVAAQITIIEDMITRGVDAIVMAACHESALIDVLQRATDAGIPVVTIDFRRQIRYPHFLCGHRQHRRRQRRPRMPWPN